MNIYDIIPDPNEKPLDRLVEGYSNTAMFRKIAFVGDSLSSGEFETHVAGENVGYHDMFEHSWGQYIARRNGSVAYNFSCGGMSTKGFDAFAARNGMWNPEKAAQAYVIALGVNDIYNGAVEEFGTIDDVDTENYRNNALTFMGYYGQIISKFKEINSFSSPSLMRRTRTTISQDVWLTGSTALRKNSITAMSSTCTNTVPCMTTGSRSIISTTAT